MAEQKRRGRRSYLAKKDLTNCYWSIRLPQQWRRIFIAGAGHRRYWITRLPFGWQHSPAICQRLIDRMVPAALRRRSRKVRQAGGNGRTAPG